MDIKELVAGLKADGKTDEEINEALKSIRDEIDAILEPAKEESVEKTEETEDDKMARVFGL